MAKMTLLELTQSICSDMSSDEINSISDTIESSQVASIIKTVYLALIGRLEKIPEHKQLGVLTALSNVLYPTYFTIPTNVNSVDWVKYNVSKTAKKEFARMNPVSAEDFINRVMSRDSSATNVQTVTDFGGVPLLIQNDKMPEYFTSFDDLHIVFDSFDVTYDTTLQESKTLCYFQIEPAWSMTDTFVPVLDANLFPLLLAEAKSTCFADLKQTANQKAEQSARRQLTATQNNKSRTKVPLDSAPNFGRT